MTNANEVTSKKYKVLDLQEYKAGIGTSTKPMWKDLELETGELWDNYNIKFIVA
mgnify:CR=1 FL=1